MEIWKQVQGFGGHYEASNYGCVKSKARTVTKRTRYGGVMQQKYPERILTPHEIKGYLRLHIGYGGKKQGVSIHTMVLCAFDRPPKEGEVCRHLDGDPQNNHPDNLKWGTHLENMQDRKRHGNYNRGSDHHMAKLKLEDVLFIRKSHLSARDVAKLFDISESHIYTVRSGEVWRHAA